jgi:hypothetical protein
MVASFCCGQRVAKEKAEKEQGILGKSEGEHRAAHRTYAEQGCQSGRLSDYVCMGIGQQVKKIHRFCIESVDFS